MENTYKDTLGTNLRKDLSTETNTKTAEPDSTMNEDAYSKQTLSTIEKLEAQLNSLKHEYSLLSAEINDNNSSISLEEREREYQKEMKRHITQLKEYNELKDLSMGLIQLIADQKHVTLRSVMDEMGIDDPK